MSDGIGLAAAIETVARLATENKTTRIVKTEQEPKGKYWIIGPDGVGSLATAQPDWHNEKLATPAELGRFIKDHKADGSTTFYDESRIAFVYDLDDRRSVATCDLPLSPQYAWLKTQSGKPMNQRDFVRTLRIVFQGCHDGSVLNLVRNLKFTSAGEVAGVVQQGRESMQKSIMAEVRGEAAIPEAMTLTVPIFENYGYNAQVACALEVMADSMCFNLTPFPMALKRSINEALDDIANLLQGEGMPPVYRGSPS